MSDSFGARLRQERERRQIPLKSIAEATKIGISLLEGLERDDVSRWPSGIFRKSFVRAYAEAIGLEPDRTVREFVERYPDPHEIDAPVANVPQKKSRSPGESSPGPLSVKLTITWSGSLAERMAKLSDWKTVRMLLQYVFR